MSKALFYLPGHPQGSQGTLFWKSLQKIFALGFLVLLPGAIKIDSASRTFAEPDAVLADRTPLKLPLTKPKLVVKKGRRELLLYSSDKLVRTYHVGLGLNPVGDKGARAIAARRKATSTSSLRMTRALSIFLLV